MDVTNDAIARAERLVAAAEERLAHTSKMIRYTEAAHDQAIADGTAAMEILRTAVAERDRLVAERILAEG